MKRILGILSFLMLVGITLSAQELNCTVSVNSSQIEGTSEEIYRTLQKSLNEFMNDRHWTGMFFSPNERIECSINITINEHPTTETFKGYLQVQARRPVYGTSYYTTLLNFKDEKFEFTYKEFDPLEFNENSFDSNLTAVMAYYAYLIIGLDSDSFSPFGGTTCFQKAENIVNMAQSSSEKGWKAFEDRKNRYEIINDLLDDRLRKYREFFYQYHRLGLDAMTTSTSNARAKIAQSIKSLEEVKNNKSNSVVLQLFVDAKDDEIVNIFKKEGLETEKKDVCEILTKINPTKSSKYEGILK